MNFNRGLLFWGLALITAGAVALAAQQGYLDRDALSGAWRLWPLILIAIGVSILLARTPFAVLGTIAAALVVGAAGGALIAVGPSFASCGGDEPNNLATERGTFDETATVTLDFNCGSLEVGTTDGDEWSVASGRDGGDPARVSADGDSLDIESGRNDRWWEGGGRQQWIVELPQATLYELNVSPNAADTTIDLGGGRYALVSVHPNAGSLTLDLTDAAVQRLDMSLNAGSAAITIGAGSALDATLSVNAGSIDVCTEDGVALRVTTDSNITFSHNLDETDLVQDGDTWSTPGYTDADDRVQIELSGNAASFTLNPDDGCA